MNKLKLLKKSYYTKNCYDDEVNITLNIINKYNEQLVEDVLWPGQVCVGLAFKKSNVHFGGRHTCHWSDSGPSSVL